MLYEAFNWRTGSGALPPEAEKYVDRWGRPGDLGAIADGDVGAAWVRLFTRDDHLDELLAQLGGAPVSLSVETDNPAVRLYERFGFVRVGYVGTAWTMLRMLG